MNQIPPPYYNDDKNSFAYPTVHKRWPTIIEGGIDDMKSAINGDSKLENSGNEIIRQLQSLLVAFKNDEEVKPFSEEAIKLNPSLIRYNESLKELNKVRKVTWLTGPWLNLECYLYQAINQIFISSEDSYWHKFDIFEKLKNQTFQQSEVGVLELCKRYEVLTTQLSDSLSQDTLKILFSEFIDISLWGNATDLSLLAGNVSLEDIQSLQGEKNRKKNEENILVNDLSQAWDHLLKKGSKEKRLDIILDNSGFELFADLIFSLFALDSGLANKIYLHSKQIPWFVSDVMPKDFDNLLQQLIDPQFYNSLKSNENHLSAASTVKEKISKYHESGQIIVKSHMFWTLDDKFWNIPKYGDLYDDLLNSDLIILKGDLNYRKLTGDVQWEPTTSFVTSIQDLAKSKLPVLSLRTCKADVVVGLPEGLNEKLIAKYKSMGNEKGEFWSSSGKWAVISFSDGYN